MAVWTDINNGDSLLDVRTKLNQYNNDTANELTNLSSSVLTNSNNISSNSTNIQSVSDGLTQEVTDRQNADTLLQNSINTNTTDIQGIKDIQTNYYYKKVAGSSTTSNTYTQLNRLTVTTPPSGVYEYKFSMTWNYNSTTKSAYFRFSTDGGVTWNEVRKEAKDVTDNYPVFYAFPYVFTQTGTDDIDLIVEYRTETNGDVLNVSYIDIVAERKQ